MGPLPGRVPIATASFTGRAIRRQIAPRAIPVEERRRRLLMAVANHSIAIAISAVFVLPFIFILLTAVMTQQQALTTHLWPSPFQWGNFAKVFSEIPLLRYTYSTLVYAVLSTIGTVASSIPVAYALSRMSWRGRNVAFLLVISTLMLPVQVTIVPLYVVFVRLHWIGSLKPLIVPAFFGDAFTIFLLRQFFLTIPQELSDAARVDGGGEFQIMTRVIMPLAKPAIAAVALFQFLYCWNDFFGPLLYTGSNPKIWTLAVGLSQYSETVHRSVLWNIQMAASVLFMLPVIVLFFLAQRVFVEGVTLTGVKG
jgi:multiple sugar transport system permease protein